MVYELTEDRTVDSWILGLVFLLTSLSILMVYSTTAVTSERMFDDSQLLIRQHVFHLFLGFVGLVLSYCLSPLKFQRYGQLLLLISLLLVIVVLIPGVGHVAGGARRWIVLGPLRVQPSELVKAMLVIYFASYIGRHRERLMRFFPGALFPFLIVGTFCALLLMEPDFGSAAVIALVVFFQLGTSSRLSHLLGVGVVAAVGLTTLIFTSPYRMRRFETFLNPFQDAKDSGYQLIQSLIAVGAGGFSGAGLGAGEQKLFYLPAAHTDFIFAVIAEELGLIGASAVVLIFLLLLYRGVLISRRLAALPFLSTLALGITLLIVLPAFLNIAVVLGLLPTKGMVLPLVAYGGTATVVNLFLIGILLRLSRLRIRV